MAAGDVEVYGPFEADDTSAIDTGLTGNGVTASDLVESHVFRGMVYFVVIKAA